MLRLLAPAKLNLFLRVLGRRPDGYHEIETIFERIDLADEITFMPQPHGITVTCNDPTLDCGLENLATKAALLLQRTSGISQGAAIHLSKQIPIASGLGGGSSDAATTLVGLNSLWNTRCSTLRLLELAAQLGSDVPFFIDGASFAIGRGRGDVCEPIPGPSPTFWHVVVVPNQQLSTKEIYEGLDRSKVHSPEDLTEAASSITMCLHALSNGSVYELAKGLYNDLEPEAIRRCPAIREIQAFLRDSGSAGSFVSGSGPAVFGLCRGATHAEGIAHQIRAKGSPSWLVRVAKTSRKSAAKVRLTLRDKR